MQAIWLVASGAPYWRAFPRPMRWWLPPAVRVLQWLARVNGALPGRRIGFGSNEARGVMTDWARTALRGRYAAEGVEMDLEQALAAYDGNVQAVTFADDWMVPPGSLRFLLSKLPGARVGEAVFPASRLGADADHYAWMKHPDAVAAWLADTTMPVAG